MIGVEHREVELTEIEQLRGAPAPAAPSRATSSAARLLETLASEPPSPTMLSGAFISYCS